MSTDQNKDENYYKQKLTSEQYHALRESGTEARFSSENWDRSEKGTYTCAACGHELFSSDAKFELDTSDWNYGWPSFDSPVNRENVELRKDLSHGMNRTEVICKNCSSHLGHLFNDGPKETTGQHYCVNGCSLNFVSKEK